MTIIKIEYSIELLGGAAKLLQGVRNAELIGQPYLLSQEDFTARHDDLFELESNRLVSVLPKVRVQITDLGRQIARQLSRDLRRHQIELAQRQTADAC